MTIRSPGVGASFALGLAAGAVFAAIVWRLNPPQLPVAATSAPTTRTSHPPTYTTASVRLEASPGGPAIAFLTPATPLTAIGEQGGWIQAEVHLYRSPDSPTVLFQDPLRLIRAGLLAAPDATAVGGTTTIEGRPWEQVRVVGWVPAPSTSDDLSEIWARASSAYARGCGHCHAVYPPNRFAAGQWVSQFRAMVPRSSLTPSQADLILKWLQAHARQ